MAVTERKIPVRIKFRKSSMLVKTALLAVLVLSAAALMLLRTELKRTKQDTEAQRSEAVALEQKNSELDEKIADLGTVEGIIRIAEEELALVEKGTIIFDSVND